MLCFTFLERNMTFIKIYIVELFIATAENDVTFKYTALWISTVLQTSCQY